MVESIKINHGEVAGMRSHRRRAREQLGDRCQREPLHRQRIPSRVAATQRVRARTRPHWCPSHDAHRSDGSGPQAYRRSPGSGRVRRLRVCISNRESEPARAGINRRIGPRLGRRGPAAFESDGG